MLSPASIRALSQPSISPHRTSSLHPGLPPVLSFPAPWTTSSQWGHSPHMQVSSRDWHVTFVAWIICACVGKAQLETCTGYLTALHLTGVTFPGRRSSNREGWGPQCRQMGTWTPKRTVSKGLLKISSLSAWAAHRVIARAVPFPKANQPTHVHYFSWPLVHAYACVCSLSSHFF